MKFSLSLLILSGLVPALLADGPKDNIPSDVRPIPPLGIEVPASDLETLKKGLAELRSAIDEAKKAQAKHPQLPLLVPDLEIYHKAVDWAIRYQEFHKPDDIKAAHRQLAEGKSRAAAFREGKAPWLQQKGLVVRGYQSKIDGSYQPYGLVIPESYALDGASPSRLDFWIHGRGEKLSELSFIDERSKSPGQIAPKNAIILHLYGRYCCANKFAGEVDLFEALEHAKQFYSIDEDRLIVRGFSMGGAAVWQFGTHFADQWCAIQPGAGFADTPEFLNVFQNEDVSRIPSFQKKLWNWYDSDEHALNLFNTNTIAYSGEIDKQKQAADQMAREAKKEGIELTHLIGPQTAHKIHPDSGKEIDRRLSEIAAIGRNRTPNEVHYTTFTLRYPSMHWITLKGLGQHWERARVDAKVLNDHSLEAKTQNVTALQIHFQSGHAPLHLLKDSTLNIDGQTLSIGRPKSDRFFSVDLHKKDGKWSLGKASTQGLAKVHGLTGPVDDAFMDAFLFVTPSQKSPNAKVQSWVNSELPRATKEWRKTFRGDIPSKKDSDVKEADYANQNLVLWGDPQSNALIAKIVAQLPIEWSEKELKVNGKTYSTEEHLPILVYPNPLNPKKYIVINSSFTFREYDYLNNARQIAKLPDWTIINLNQAPNSMLPGKISDAGFFDENWKFQTK